MQSNFGAGFMFGIPPGQNRPVLFAASQGGSVDLAFDLKKMYGTGNFPIEQARGKGTIDIKASVGRVDPYMFNSLFFSQSLTTGEVLGSMAEPATIPSATAYTVTVANGANFSADLGVFDTATQRFMDLVTAAPAAGQYMVNKATGVYTFSAADEGLAIKIYYTYASASTGKTITGINTEMDAGPVFGIALVTKFRNKTLYMNFPAVVSSKLSMPMKLDDFTLPSLDMSAQDDGSGNIFSWTATT